VAVGDELLVGSGLPQADSARARDAVNSGDPRSREKDDVTIAIIAAVLGLLIATAAIGIPQLVRIRHQRPDDDTVAYLQETGRSARDIAQGNAAVRRQQQDDAAAEQANGD
jgi:superfamily II DNA helicase RecQ